MIKNLLILFMALFLAACSGDDDFPTGSGSTGTNTSSWLVPESELEFGANKDAIRAVDDPVFSSIDQITYLEDDDLLLVMKLENEICL